MEKIFAARLRQARQSQQLTLDALAERSGVSRAALSKIERAERAPSLTYALQIAEAIGVPLAELIGQSIQAIAVTRRGAGQRMIEAGSGALREALLQPYPGTEVVRYTVPPLSRTDAYPAHEPGTREGFVVISGQIEVSSGDVNIALSAGDAAALPVDCAHYVANPGTQEAVYLLLIGRPR